MVNDLMNNLQVDLFEGPDTFIDLAFPKKLNEHLSLSRPSLRIWEKLD
jgi:hypothetical protein